MIPQIFKNENLYDKQIENVSKKFNVPVPLIKAFIAIESGFNPNAYRYEEHRKDASYGLMQILYQTAKGFGFKGLPQDLYNPDVNIYWASQYIAYLYKRFGNLPDTFASYNMGLPRPASKTTNIITKIYGKPQPNWKYANQPYVDK
ncbi:MAG: transglycosylase SLT domain-containing protein [Candidatus Aenigmatarchaeota archaeon]